MARARNIKPSIFKNELLGTRDPLLTLLFIGLWGLADREGRLEHRPLRIKAEIFPYRTIDAPLFNGYLTELASLGFIHIYEAGGIEIIQVVKFSQHQAPHKTEKASTLPAYVPENKTVTDLTVKAPLNNGGLTDVERPESLLLNHESPFTDSLVSASASPEPQSQIAEAHTMFDRFPLKEFFNAFPDAQISPSQAGMIESTVTLADAEAWKLTLEHYKANYDPRRNRYLPEKVGNLLSVFRSQKEKLNGQRPEPKRLPTAEELERENAAERADRSNWVYPTPRNDQEPRPIIDRPSR